MQAYHGGRGLRSAIFRNSASFQQFITISHIFSATFLTCPCYVPVGALCCQYGTMLVCTTM